MAREWEQMERNKDGKQGKQKTGDELSREESRTKDCCVFEDKERRRSQRQGPR